jgi:xanthine dehydrogenase accessory factor
VIDLGKAPILIKGGGDLASGVAIRLFRSGFPVAMTELPNPLMVRRTVSFGEAVNAGRVQVEGVPAVRVDGPEEALRLLELRGAERAIPVMIDPEARCRSPLNPAAMIDAIMAKRNTGTSMSDAPLVVALGPGFSAGKDCHVVIETNRGHDLGRPIFEGSAEPDTGIPGEIGGRTVERLLRAPVSGRIRGLVEIGEGVSLGQVVAMVDVHEVRSRLDGVLRGLVRTGAWVDAGLKIGDVDPRFERDHCYLVSDKSLAIGGGVLETVLGFLAGTLLAHLGHRGGKRPYAGLQTSLKCLARDSGCGVRFS